MPAPSRTSIEFEGRKRRSQTQWSQRDPVRHISRSIPPGPPEVTRIPMNDASPPNEALHALYRQYADDVYRYARMMLGNAPDAYDAVQEVFLRALRAWGSYRGEASARTWLIRIAKNYLADVRRKRRVESKYISRRELQDVGREDGTADAVLEVEWALRQLRPAYRQVVVLRYIENLSVEETAQVLGWSASKVRTTAHRAMMELRRMWGEAPEGGVQPGES